MLFCILSLQARESYRGHQVIRARVETAAQAALLGPALGEYDLWSEVAVGGSLDIRVAPHQAAALARLLDRAGVQHRVLIPDLETLVAGARMGPGVGRRPVECSNSKLINVHQHFDINF